LFSRVLSFGVCPFPWPACGDLPRECGWWACACTGIQNPDNASPGIQGPAACL